MRPLFLPTVYNTEETFSLEDLGLENSDIEDYNIFSCVYNNIDAILPHKFNSKLTHKDMAKIVCGENIYIIPLPFETVLEIFKYACIENNQDPGTWENRKHLLKYII